MSMHKVDIHKWKCIVDSNIHDNEAHLAFIILDNKDQVIIGAFTEGHVHSSVQLYEYFTFFILLPDL